MTFERIRPTLRALMLGACVATPIHLTAQDAPYPPAAAPATPQVVRTLSPQESVAMARDRAADSMRRWYNERRDSILHARRLERARAQAARRWPTSDGPPFYGYTWVFYADIVAGAIIGLTASIIRWRNSDTTLSTWRAIAGMIAGGVGGACVFIACFFLAIFASVLSFFGDPSSAIAVFGWSLSVMALTVIFVAVSKGRA